MRLQKALAEAGIASRRKAEELITSGQIKVNGVVVTELGFKVKETDEIFFNDELVVREDKVYLLLNKPTGYVSTVSDEKGRKTVLDLINPEDVKERIYPVGRLDSDTAGLIILTNDGDLTYSLTHPKHEVEKEYLARVKGIVVRNKAKEIKNGVVIDDNYLAVPKEVRIVELDKEFQTTLLSITLTEGKNREVRKIFEAAGHPVINLTRVRIANLTTEGVGRGYYRRLKIHEIKYLKNL
ncbi:MAG TPA: pseudouridine synthase [Acholeplasmataceae bacterium]|jgi:23S rRNA pseudouridine2605 synthase|nr:pseudouridine synthase [Acholeplasmataceae bacterium]HQC30449.1 pseudouridine synthase [Acholeplasmataceae bacterium]